MHWGSPLAGNNGAGAASSRSSSSTSRSLNPDSQIQLVQNAFASAQAPMVPGGGAAPMSPKVPEQPYDGLKRKRKPNLKYYNKNEV